MFIARVLVQFNLLHDSMN